MIIERRKSHLVAKGCSQKYDIHYNEVFSPVVRYDSIRLIFALAVEFDYMIHQMDITTVYLYGELVVPIFMQQPEGFVEKDNETKVCLLKK